MPHPKTNCLLSRYLAGDCLGVWRALHAVPNTSTVDVDARADIDAVVCETIDRAALNIRLIGEHLTASGFEFAEQQWLDVSEGRAVRESLIAAVGSIPPVLGAWLLRPTMVSFRGRPATIDADTWTWALVDPFEFWCSRESVESDLECYREADPLRIDVAGDTYIKNDISGGSATYITLSSPSIDARVFESAEQTAEDDGMWFVDYLRRYLTKGGFCLTKLSAANAARLVPPTPEGLVPF
jgi:hypothetical protein